MWWWSAMPTTRRARREIFDLLSKPSNNVAVNMVGLKTDERPDYFAKLLPELAETAGSHRAAALARHRRGASSAAGGARWRVVCQGAVRGHPDHRAS